MPAGDRTGPMGAGPMSGRGAGFCVGFPAPGFANPMFAGGRGMGGWGRGRGGGGGRGWRHWFHATGLTAWQRATMMPVAPPTDEQQLAALKEQADCFAEALDGIRKRIDEIEARAQKG